MSWTFPPYCWWPQLLVALVVAGASDAMAQRSLGPSPTVPALQAPETSTAPVPPMPIPNVGAPTLITPDSSLRPGTPPSPPPLVMPSAPAAAPLPRVRPGESMLTLTARFAPDAATITGGLHWRIYADKPDQAGVFRLIREDRSARPILGLPSGGYIVHVGFGLASAAKPVQLSGDAVEQVFEIPAGGLTLKGQVGDVRIPSGQIFFDVYRGSQFEPGERRPIVSSVVTGDVVIVPEGTYYILSKYGDGNSVVRSDIRVLVGKLTDVTVTHRAAAIMLKLVANKGGEALANTDWAVVSPAGDVISESKGAFPRVILAEGQYKVIARNDNKTYQQDLRVITGVDGEVEVLAR